MSFMRKIKLQYFFYRLSLTRALKENITVGHSFCLNGFIKTNSSHFPINYTHQGAFGDITSFVQNRTVLGAIFSGH
jgi:hypothetical protein